MSLFSTSQSLLFSKFSENASVHEYSISESLLDKYSGLLYGIIIRIVRDQQSAEEVLQQVIRQMTMESEQPHSRHLKLITRMAQLARTLSNVKISEHPEFVSLPQPDNDFARPAFPGLSQSERELVERVILDGESQQEVAQSLSIPLSVVRSKMRIGVQVSDTSKV